MALLYRNDTIFTDFFDDVGDEFANFGIASRNSSDLSDFLAIAINLFSGFINTLNDFCASSFDALAKVHRIMASCDKLVGFGDDVISEDGYGSCAITGDLIEFLGCGLN